MPLFDLARQINCKEKAVDCSIRSDMWWSYHGIQNIPDMNYTPLTVNHSKSVVDPVSGAHTQRFESLWGSAKFCNRKECETRRNMLDSYPSKFLRRKEIRV